MSTYLSVFLSPVQWPVNSFMTRTPPISKSYYRVGGKDLEGMKTKTYFKPRRYRIQGVGDGIYVHFDVTFLHY